MLWIRLSGTLQEMPQLGISPLDKDNTIPLFQKPELVILQVLPTKYQWQFEDDIVLCSWGCLSSGVLAMLTRTVKVPNPTPPSQIIHSCFPSSLLELFENSCRQMKQKHGQCSGILTGSGISGQIPQFMKSPTRKPGWEQPLQAVGKLALAGSHHPHPEAAVNIWACSGGQTWGWELWPMMTQLSQDKKHLMVPAGIF